jgi:polysaccharide chain length determinant protein (PEP-CTERM system associated)
VIPGKQYKPEDFIEAAWRRRWYILVPLVVISAGTFTVTRTLPDRYLSPAQLLIVPQRVPENFVRPTVTARLDERLQAMNREILSRTKLEAIVQEFDLYPEERKTMIMEDVVQLMRTRDIKLQPPRRGDNAFLIGFEYSEPRTAMLVTERLASLFIRENIEDRTLLADQADQFLQSQLQEMERELKEREKKLVAFKRSNPGVMPEQMNASQQALSNAGLELRGVQESIMRDRDELVKVRRQIADLTAAAAVTTPPEPITQPSVSLTAARALEVARAQRQALLLKLKPTHPNVKALDRTIKELEQKAAEEALQQPVSAISPGISPAEAARIGRLSDLQGEESTLVRRIGQKQEDEKRLMAAMTTYRLQLERAPVVESELTELMRDYATIQSGYQQLLMKSQEAKVSANLERRQIGEQFKVVDSATLPWRPTSPNRLKYNLMGALAGLGLGLGLAALLEYRDTSLRTEDDVLVALSLPVLAMVPTMVTTTERRRRKRQKLLLASSGALALLVSIAALAWKFQILNEWKW